MSDIINNADTLYICDAEGHRLDKFEHGDRILRHKIVERLKKQESKQPTFSVNARYIKLFIDNIMPVLKQVEDQKGKIKYSTIALMLYLMQFISYRDGLLQSKNGRPITNTDIIKNFNMGRNEIYANLKILKECNIISITKVKDKEYYIFNPFIACNGSRIDNTTKHIFKENLYELKYTDNSEYSDPETEDNN